MGYAVVIDGDPRRRPAILDPFFLAGNGNAIPLLAMCQLGVKGIIEDCNQHFTPLIHGLVHGFDS